MEKDRCTTCGEVPECDHLIHRYCWTCNRIRCKDCEFNESITWGDGKRCYLCLCRNCDEYYEACKCKHPVGPPKKMYYEMNAEEKQQFRKEHMGYYAMEEVISSEDSE